MWILKTNKGIEFTVRPNMNDAERRELYLQLSKDKSYIGKKMTLTHSAYSNDGIPCHIRECILRDYE